MARLIVYFDRNKVAHYDFDIGVVNVGRHPESQIFLPHNSVSREQLRVVGTEAGWSVHNSGGKNVIFVNGSIMKTERNLDDKDRIEFGRYIILFREEQGDEGEQFLDETGILASPSAPKPTGSEKSDGTMAYNLSQLRALRSRADKLSKPHLTWSIGRDENLLNLGRDTVIIGSSEDADVVIPGGLAVSAEHATIQQRADDEFVVESTGWLAKIKVNGEPVRGAHVLQDGDRIEIGKVLLHFKTSMFEE